MGDIKICAVDGCCKQVRAKGLCAGHYARKERTGETGPAVLRMSSGGACLVEGCEQKAESKGYCCTHYGRLRRHGSPTGGIRCIRGSHAKWLQGNKTHEGDDCLIWPYSRYPSGYGSTNFNGKGMHASRAMCILAHGEPPTPSHEAAHSCGNGQKGCCNPKHLRWATSAENSADMIAHGNSPRGTRHGMSKITPEDVLEIRRRAITEKHRDIARSFGLSESHVSSIVKRKDWAWLA